MPVHRTWFQEVELSFRHSAGKLECVFVTATGVEGSAQRSVLASRHFVGSPERLIDEALAYTRELVLEHVLAGEEPF